MTITSPVLGSTGSSMSPGTAAAPALCSGPSPVAPRVLRLTGVAEDTHHWYEESDIGRHVPQVIGVAEEWAC